MDARGGEGRRTRSFDERYRSQVWRAIYAIFGSLDIRLTDDWELSELRIPCLGIKRRPSRRVERLLSPEERRAWCVEVIHDFRDRTRKPCSAERRVVGKAEALVGSDDPRFVVTSLSVVEHEARTSMSLRPPRASLEFPGGRLFPHAALGLSLRIAVNDYEFSGHTVARHASGVVPVHR